MKLSDHTEHIRKLIDSAFRNRLGRMGITSNQLSDISSVPQEYHSERNRIETIREVWIAETGTVAEAYEKLIEEFKDDPAVELFSGDSVLYLEQILQKYPNDNFLFWLDGHYPGEIYNGLNGDYLLPLKKELDIIFRHNGNNVITIDDLRIYEDTLSYENGPLPENTFGDKLYLITKGRVRISQNGKILS